MTYLPIYLNLLIFFLLSVIFFVLFSFSNLDKVLIIIFFICFLIRDKKKYLVMTNKNFLFNRNKTKKNNFFRVLLIKMFFSFRF